jgi:hypothetical protein
MPYVKQVAVIAALLAFGWGAQGFAGGDQNAYNNPTGDPPTDTYQEPFANYDNEGRLIVSCATNERLTMVQEDGAVELTCQVDD